MKALVTVLAAIVTICISTGANAFCGFYVARADTSLFNRASQVVLVRDGDRTVITMANDFEGDVKDFAVVVPVPTFIERSQINVGDKAVIDHLDAYTSPRLVEYFDPDPCIARGRLEMAQDMSALPSSKATREAGARSSAAVSTRPSASEVLPPALVPKPITRARSSGLTQPTRILPPPLPTNSACGRVGVCGWSRVGRDSPWMASRS